MKMLLALTFSGSVLTLVLFLLKRVFGKRLSSTVYYYAWLLVLLRFSPSGSRHDSHGRKAGDGDSLPSPDDCICHIDYA